MNKAEYLKQIDEVIAKGPFTDDWESLCRHETPRWYMRDKFGIFIHWGAYSVPAFGNEWYPRNMYRKNSPEYLHHKKNYGDPAEFGYKDFIPLFKAERFEPEKWADLFREAGARFVMPVGEHHDGFQMYKSELSSWNSAEMGPHRDVVGELKQAVENRGMRICVSSHRAEHWWFYNNGRKIPSDVQDDAFVELYGPAAGETLAQNSLYDNQPDKEFLDDWLMRTCEIVDRYHPSIMYFDWWIQVMAFKPYLKKFAAYYYNRAVEWGVEVAIDAKLDAFPLGAAVCDIERGQFSDMQRIFWLNDTSVAKNSWCYSDGNDYKTAQSIICDLVDVVSKNGALLLNVGPRADGTIPDEDAALLRAVGKWLSVNGDAIYDTHPWRVSGEGPTEVPEGMFSDTNRSEYTSEDIRYTMRGQYIYATVLKWPEDGIVRLKEMGHASKRFRSDIEETEILGYGVSPNVERRDALEITAKLELIDDMPVVIRFKVK